MPITGDSLPDAPTNAETLTTVDQEGRRFMRCLDLLGQFLLPILQLRHPLLHL
jgi:hypothetical protein